MQLPLTVCQQFGQFAFQDEQKGVEAIAAIQDFIEEYHDISVSVPESQAKVVTVVYNEAGVTAAKTQKALPNLVLNIKEIVTNSEKLLGKSIEVVTNVSGLSSGNWLFNVVTGLRLIQFAIELTTVDLTTKQAWVLVALHHLCGGKLQLEIPLSELQDKMRHNDPFSLSAEELDKILKELKKLRCISRRKNTIYLTEKVVLKDN